MIDAYLGRISAGQNLAMDEMSEVVDLIMQGQVTENLIGLLLTALHSKGESVSEVAGAAQAMRKHMSPIRSDRKGLIDTCGTGGDGSGTFNISTAAAIVTAAAGVPVAKHGNRRMTSKSGSADVLSALGVNIDADVPTVERCIDSLGLGFCFAPLLHPAMKNVAAVRRQLGFPTIFNLLGPLSNPASAPFQLLGVGKPHLRPLLAEALGLLDIERAIVVCGADGLDEVTLGDTTHVTLVQRGQPSQQQQWEPSDFGLENADTSTMQASDPATSAKLIRQILHRQPGPPRDIVVLNAAAALWTAHPDTTLQSCAQQAGQAIDSGAAQELLERLAELSHG